MQSLTEKSLSTIYTPDFAIQFEVNFLKSQRNFHSGKRQTEIGRVNRALRRMKMETRGQLFS